MACACQCCHHMCVCVCVCTGVHLHFMPHYQCVSILFCSARRAAVHIRAVSGWLAMVFSAYPTVDNLREYFESCLEFVE